MSAPASEKVDLSKYIETRDGRPNIRGRRLPVIFIIGAYQARNLTVSEIAYDYTITEEQVLAALLYYREHKEELDRQDAADRAESEEYHRLYGGMPGKT